MPKPQLPTDFSWLNRLFTSVEYLEFHDPAGLTDISEISDLLPHMMNNPNPDIIVIDDMTEGLHSLFPEDMTLGNKTYSRIYKSSKINLMFEMIDDGAEYQISEKMVIYA